MIERDEMTHRDMEAWAMGVDDVLRLIGKPWVYNGITLSI